MSRPGVLLRWCVPDLAFATACVTLFYCLFLFQGYQRLFRDSDAGWHIRTGEAILATATLPRTDPYSFTRGGQPWFAWEWLPSAPTLILKPSCWTLSGCISIPRKMLWCYAWMRNQIGRASCRERV